MSLSMMLASATAGARPADATTVPAPSGSSAPAATIAPDQGSQVEATTSAGIADIVATAQRRRESLQRAPIAISVVFDRALVSANTIKPIDLPAVVPTPRTTTIAGLFALLYLRDIGTLTRNTFSDLSISFNHYGVYISRTSGVSGFFYDLERVEVVKSRQGTLYGRNATGDAINRKLKQLVADLSLDKHILQDVLARKF